MVHKKRLVSKSREVEGEKQMKEHIIKNIVRLIFTLVMFVILQSAGFEQGILVGISCLIASKITED